MSNETTEKKYLSKQCCIGIWCIIGCGIICLIGIGRIVTSPEGQQICASGLQKVNNKIEEAKK